jgi:hypothetical protein
VEAGAFEGDPDRLDDTAEGFGVADVAMSEGVLDDALLGLELALALSAAVDVNRHEWIFCFSPGLGGSVFDQAAWNLRIE